MKQDIIRMAREVNNGKVRVWEDCHLLYPDELERFAALVAAAEREACAKVAENRMLGDASATEKVAHHTACKNIAQDIRARGQA
jgi:hypothetical protein